jgi:F0F1-type ATP synthase membrane subunit b/b'
MTGVEQEVFRLRQETQEKITQKLEKANQEIQNYRNQKIQEINQKVYQLLGKIAKKILGKSINLALHEELVKEILKKSKEEIFKDYE